MDAKAKAHELRCAALEKGRATQDLAKGKIKQREKIAIETRANRVLGKTFHTHKGN